MTVMFWLFSPWWLGHGRMWRCLSRGWCCKVFQWCIATLTWGGWSSLLGVKYWWFMHCGQHNWDIIQHHVGVIRQWKGLVWIMTQLARCYAAGCRFRPHSATNFLPLRALLIVPILLALCAHSSSSNYWQTHAPGSHSRNQDLYLQTKYCTCTVQILYLQTPLTIHGVQTRQGKCSITSPWSC